MEELKCISCGGKVDINEELMIGVCEYCGRKESLPKDIYESIKLKRKTELAQAEIEKLEHEALMEKMKCASCGGNIAIDEELMTGVCEYCGRRKPLPNEIYESIKLKQKTKLAQAEIEKQEQSAQIEAERQAVIKKKIKKIALIVVPSIAMFTAFLIILFNFIIPNSKYHTAMNYYNDKNYIKAAVYFADIAEYKDSSTLNKECNYLQATMYFNAKNYSDAIVLFEKLGSYKDSKTLLNECNYMIANQYLNNKQYRDAVFLYETLDSYKDSGTLYNKYKFYELIVGDIITFGNYEQDNNLKNGKEAISWKVLAVENGKALLLSEYGLDDYQYMRSGNEAEWEVSILRKWLNNEFLKSAFTEAEQKRIIYSKLKNTKGNGTYSKNTEEGKDTSDYIFVLSMSELSYLPDKSYMILKPTAYAEANGTSIFKGSCYWWLRDSEYTNGCYVTYKGEIKYWGMDSCAVRPAIWIKLDTPQ